VVSEPVVDGVGASVFGCADVAERDVGCASDWVDGAGFGEEFVVGVGVPVGGDVAGGFPDEAVFWVFGLVGVSVPVEAGGGDVVVQLEVVVHGRFDATSFECPGASDCFGGDPLGQGGVGFDLVDLASPTGKVGEW
jgi:hypothetical protein